jgi:hypothetical protein
MCAIHTSRGDAALRRYSRSPALRTLIRPPIHGSQPPVRLYQFSGSFILHAWLLHCRALTCQSGWRADIGRWSFQIGTTREPQAGQGGSICARRCALFMLPPKNRSAKKCCYSQI